MQGDWWISSNFNSPRDNSEQTAAHSAWESAGTTPSVVTLTVHPLESKTHSPGSGFRSGGHHRHSLCSQSSFGVASSVSNLILAAQRRKRLYLNQQKNSSYLQASKKLGFGSQPDIVEPDLTWTSFFENARTQGSNNSALSNQDGGQTSSSAVSTSTAPAAPGGPGAGLGVSQQMSNDDLKQFERKLEREREKRIHPDPPPARLDTRVLPDSSQQYDFNMKRNGFRPTSKNAFMTRGEQSMALTGFRHSHTPPVDPLGSFTITNSAPQGHQGPQAATTTPGTLRGQSIGFGSREGGTGAGLSATGGSSTSQGRPVHLKTRSRSILLAGQSEKYRQNQYQFADPASGATPDFTQRLAELNALEGDTIRYERTKKAKKKAKQDSG